MGVHAAFLMMLAAAPSPAVDPIAACRSLHPGDSAQHIACLEEALRARAPATVVVPVAPVVPAATASLGADQVEARQRSANPQVEKPQQTVQIVAVNYDSLGRGVFRTADGQVWRETEKTPEHMRAAPGRQYTARIEQAGLGGYRLYVDGVRRMLKVERLQ